MKKRFRRQFATKAYSKLRQGWNATDGQDLLEYALMAALVAVAAGAIMPNMANSISTIFSKVVSLMTAAGNQGS
jgi:Flp pilus assembly pilin Flp